MLVNFSATNWMSFRDEFNFNLGAGDHHVKGRKIPFIKDFNASVLPIAAIYGGNASGKSNFISAIDFARDFVLSSPETDESIPYTPFLLDSTHRKEPCNFKFTILIEGKLFDYSFSVNNDIVIKEKLIEVSKNGNEKLYFSRLGSKYYFGSRFKKSSIRNAKSNTRKNRLFLNSSVNLNIENFRPIYDWFKNSVLIISPGSRFSSLHKLVNEEDKLFKQMNDTLFQFDTGISGIKSKELPSEIVNAYIGNKLVTEEGLKEGIYNIGFGNKSFTVTSNEGRIVANRPVFQHLRTDGGYEDFEVGQESDGTQRLFNLLPAFFELTSESSSKVLIIDEIDRSMHSNLTKNLILSYLESCSKNTRAQLIFTTHDLLLMSVASLRRDEMWVTERDIEGVSSIYSIGDIKDIGKDKSIFDLYLDGVLGGIPHILFENSSEKPFSRSTL